MTIGDPFGIGPEICVNIARDISRQSTVIFIGNPNWCELFQVPAIQSIDQASQPGFFFYPVSSCPPGSEISFEFVRTAVDWALAHKVDAIVTAPISKEKWFRAGLKYNGHTDFLARYTGVTEHAMFFWSGSLKIALFTVHIPLKDIFSHLQKEPIIQFIRFIDAELTRLFKKKFSFLIPGLNPHAGENGFLGSEEIEIIIPAMKTLKMKYGIDIQGPFPPDVIFLMAREIQDSVVISWYHDQGLIGFKLLNIHEGVNMTLGLPFIRTSPDHGTAFDIAGKGIANPSSMKQALDLAEQLAVVNSSGQDSI